MRADKMGPGPPTKTDDLGFGSSKSRICTKSSANTEMADARTFMTQGYDDTRKPATIGFSRQPNESISDSDSEWVQSRFHGESLPGCWWLTTTGRTPSLHALLTPTATKFKYVGNAATPRIIRENPPDVILLDVVMPGKSGIELCRELKSNPETRLIPVVMIRRRSARSLMPSIMRRSMMKCAGSKIMKSKSISGKLA